jgi:hypothetical protein
MYLRIIKQYSHLPVWFPNISVIDTQEIFDKLSDLDDVSLESLLELDVSLKPNSYDMPVLLEYISKFDLTEAKEAVTKDGNRHLNRRIIPDTTLDYEHGCIVNYLGEAGVDFSRQFIHQYDNAFNYFPEEKVYTDGTDITGCHALSYIMVIYNKMSSLHSYLPVILLFDDKELNLRRLKYVATCDENIARETFGVKFSKSKLHLNNCLFDIIVSQVILNSNVCDVAKFDSYLHSTTFKRKKFKGFISIHNAEVKVDEIVLSDNDPILDMNDYKFEISDNHISKTILQKPEEEAIEEKIPKIKVIRDKPKPKEKKTTSTDNHSISKKKAISSPPIEKIFTTIEEDYNPVTIDENIKETVNPCSEDDIELLPMMPFDEESKEEYFSCKKKSQYPSNELALAKAATFPDRVLRTYKCGYCGHWHLTSMKEPEITFNGGKIPLKIIGPLGEQYVVLVKCPTDSFNEIFNTGTIIAVKKNKGHFVNYSKFGQETTTECKYWRIWRDLNHIPFRGKSTFFYELVDIAVANSVGILPIKDEKTAASPLLQIPTPLLVKNPEEFSGNIKHKELDGLLSLIDSDKDPNFKLGVLYERITNMKKEIFNAGT